MPLFFNLPTLFYTQGGQTVSSCVLTPCLGRCYPKREAIMHHHVYLYQWPNSYLGSGIIIIFSASLPFGMPMFRQHGAHRMHGLSPRRMSPTIEYTAGTFEQARQFPSSGGVIPVVSGYPEGGSCACNKLNKKSSTRWQALGNEMTYRI